MRETLVYDMEDQNFDALAEYLDTHEMYYTAENSLSYSFSPTRGKIAFQFFPIVPQDIELYTDNRIYGNTPSLVLLDPVLQTTAPRIHVYAYNQETQEYDTLIDTEKFQKYSYALHQLSYTDEEQEISIPALLPYYEYAFSVPINDKYTEYTLDISYADRVIEDPSGYRFNFMSSE